MRAARVAGSNTEHIALWANCSLAAAGLHEMAGHSDTQCKTEIRRDLGAVHILRKHFYRLVQHRMYSILLCVSL